MIVILCLYHVCCFAFDNLISCEWNCKRIDVKVLRKYSTIIYCVHASLAGVIEHYWISDSNFTDCVLKIYSCIGYEFDGG